MKTKACEPGTGYSCFRNGCSGHQRCLDDGSGFTPCECDPPSAGSKAGTGGRGGSGQGTGGQSSSNGVERCDNDRDDDGDGKVDCADSDCSDMRCTIAAPSGWEGPVVFREGADLGSCTGAYDTRVFEAGADLEAAAASCSSCSCEGSGCASFVDFRVGSEEQCGGQTCTTSVNRECTEIAPSCLKDVTDAYLQTRLSANSGCKASEQHADIPEPHWKTRALACKPGAVQRGGCKNDEVCLPAAISGEFEDNYCVWSDGDKACPKAEFTHKRLFHRAWKDSRECSACSCGAGGCEYRWRIFNADDTDCASPVLELSSANECVQVNPSAGKLRVGAMISGDGGECSASGGESRGEAVADQAVTVCCVPR